MFGADSRPTRYVYYEELEWFEGDHWHSRDGVGILVRVHRDQEVGRDRLWLVEDCGAVGIGGGW